MVTPLFGVVCGATGAAKDMGRLKAQSPAWMVERLPRAQLLRFRPSTTNGSGGATTPIEMMYLSASSTLIARPMTSLRGTIRKKPEVGLGVVGTYRLR